MGKHGKKQRHQDKSWSRGHRNTYPQFQEQEEYEQQQQEQGDEDEEQAETSGEEQEEEELEQDKNHVNSSGSISKFSLYQQSVQSPKGDISYLQKFFLMYVGGRAPLHLQEDFCGTALLSTEWVRTDPRRTAIGVDLDLEALVWCMENNVDEVGDDNSSRVALFHGNVLQPLESRLVNTPHDLSNLKLNDGKEITQDMLGGPSPGPAASVNANGGIIKRDCPLPARDILCAFNYSCCCLHKRTELVSYFKHALAALSVKGGIFVMDLYGGTSSERGLKLHRKFPDFTYTWEQQEFDVIERKTRISLHYQLYKPQKKIRNAFSYSWRLWSLPEIRDCLEEAGFRQVHFWIREMPDTGQNRKSRGLGTSRDDKYEEVSSFQQQDAWNAYVVAVV